MKKPNTILLLFFILSLLLNGQTMAQTKPAEDFVVTLSGDTLYGKVKPLLYDLEKRVQLSQDGKKKITYTILQVRGYRFKGEIFHPIRESKGYTFMKLVKSGYVSLYAFQMENQTTFDGLYLVKRDGQSTEVPNLGFKKNMAKFLSECEGVQTRIDQGEFGRKDLHTILDEFNACIENKSIKQKEAMVQVTEGQGKIKQWETLEAKINALDAFEGKATSLEMMAEIKNKITKNEKVPSFIKDGLKNALADQESLKEELEKALATLTEN